MCAFRRSARHVVSVDDRALCEYITTRRLAVRPGQARSRATIRQPVVRSGDASRRRVGLRRSRHRLAAGRPEGRAHACPTRGECATREQSLARNCNDKNRYQIFGRDRDSSRVSSRKSLAETKNLMSNSKCLLPDRKSAAETQVVSLTEARLFATLDLLP